MKVSVLTASVGGYRLPMLEEAIASVVAQTHGNHEHLIGMDESRLGAGQVLNHLLGVADGEYIMVLDDDDLLDADHLELLVPHCEDADVVYSMPRVVGGNWEGYTRSFSSERLASMNCVSHNALLRTDLVREIGGWDNIKQFDWDLFKRLDEAGAKFRQLDGITSWTYRLHGDNWSRGGLLKEPVA